MTTVVQQSAKGLVERAAALGQHGVVAGEEELQQLNRDMGNRMPCWYIELLTSVPLCGLEFGWQAYEPDGDFDGIEWLQWSDPANIRSESLECYPGVAILERGYINVASDMTGGGNPYFIPADQGHDPPLFQVYHDISDDPDIIVQEGCQLVANSLSEFFTKSPIFAV